MPITHSSRLQQEWFEHKSHQHLSESRQQSSAKWGEFAHLSIPEQYPPDLEIEPLHIDIDLFVDVANRRASGCVTTTVVARRADIASLTLHAQDLDFASVADSTGRGIEWNYDGEELQLEWADPFEAGEKRDIVIEYMVGDPVDGLYFSQPDDAYPSQPWYAATDHETERARHWLPCLDLPNVRTTLEFRLRAESRFTILANGELLDEVIHDDPERLGTKTAHWRLEQRCPSYLICFAIGDFTIADDGSYNDGTKEIPCVYFCSPYHSPQDLLRTFGRTKRMMAWMTQKLDMPFPYPKYYQFALPGISGAMENISLVSWTDSLLQDSVLAQEHGWLVDQINVHEMAHSYFGDAIVCRDFAHGWLKESWATYVEQLWREDEYTAEEAQYVYYNNAQQYFAEAERYQRPIVTRRFKSSWDMYDVHLYEGGACRLHTLRCEIGDDVFFAATRDYLKRYSERVVETDDFRHVCEEHSGRSLGQFFDQWFHRPGYPDLDVTFKFDTKRKRGTFTIKQSQVDQAAGIPAFHFSTEVSWVDTDGVTHIQPVTIEQDVQIVSVAMKNKPQQVRFDANNLALHRLSFKPCDTMLRRQLTQAPDIIGRIQAANELAKTGKRVNLQAVVDAYKRESFWGVRREFADALGSANHEVAIEGLAGIIESEQDPMVLQYVFKAAANYRDSRVRDAIVARVGQEDLPYVALAAAYHALGQQRDAAPFGQLAEASLEESFNGLAQAGALHGLGASRQAEAVDLLLERSNYGTVSRYARSAAATALGDLGRGLEKRERERVVERLVDLLRDPQTRTQLFAARALGNMQASEALTPLDTYARSVTKQTRVDVERIVDRIRGADKVDGSSVKRELEELREKVRKLENQIQRLDAKRALDE